jgi:E3 ubiquitin-protein ligase ZNF598
MAGFFSKYMHHRRYSAFMARILSLAPNSATAVPAVKAAVRGYRASETSARDLILIFWNVMDQNLDDTASIVNALVDFIDEDEKKTDILGAWNGFKIEVCFETCFLPDSLW